MKRNINKCIKMSDDEVKNLEILTKKFRGDGGYIYPSRVVNHLIYEECKRQGLEPFECVDDTIVLKKKRNRVVKEKYKTKKAIEKKELEERILNILR